MALKTESACLECRLSNEQILMEGHKFIIYQILPRLPTSIDLPARLRLFQYLVSRQLQLVVCRHRLVLNV